MSLDLVTLALAKKYTDEKAGGGDSGIIIECTMERYEKGTIWFDIASQNIPTGTSEHIKNALSSGCVPNVLVKCEWEYDRDNFTRYVVPYAFEADSSECIIYLMFHEDDEPQKFLIYV